MQWDGIGDEFNDSRIRCQGKDLVRSDSQIPLPSSSVVLKKTAYLFEHLFHYGVLSQIIVPSLELFISLNQSTALSRILTQESGTYQLLILYTICSNSGDNLRCTNTRSNSKLRTKPGESWDIAIIAVITKLNFHCRWWYLPH